jgi:3-hydroxyacyl-CoA dehydrogenase
LNEVWRLVADGILNVTDIDNVMSEGLGMRYAFLGPLETAHLNAEGTREWFFLHLDHHTIATQTHSASCPVTSPCSLAKGLHFSPIFLKDKS